MKLPAAGSEPIGARRLWLVLVGLALVVPLVGFAVFGLYSPQIEREAAADLEVIVRLKAEQIENWLDERWGDSEVLAGDDSFAAQVARFVRQQHDTGLTRPILERFDQLRSSYHYSKILLLDASGRVLLASGEEKTTEPVLSAVWRAAQASKQVQRRDIYRDEDGHIHLEWVVPIGVSQVPGERPLALVVLRVTAQDFLFPLIQSWPTASASGETLLVRRDGESVIYLNELRHRQDTALKLTLSFADEARISAAALHSASPGLLRGRDYRGVPVLAVHREVAGTSWHIVAKLDRAEVLAPLWVLVRWVSLIALAALAVVGALLLLLWRQQQHAYRLEVRARSLAAIEASEQRYRAVTQSANDAIVIADSAGNIVECNPSAARLFGYTETGLLGQAVTLLMPARYRERHREGLARVASGGRPDIMGQTIEFAGLRRDGGEFPLEISLAQWQTAAGRFFSATLRDITERKAAEKKIRRLTQLYAALSQCNEAIVRSTSADELFPQICRDAVQYGDMKMAWIGLVDEASRMVRPVASYGDGMAYLEHIRISLDDESSSECRLSRTAILENQPCWSQDFQHDPLTAPSHERGARFGWGAAASLPLRRNDVVIGAYTLYAGAVNAFDEAARRLLIEMATDISFALNGFERESRRRQSELKLTESERHFHSLFDNMLEGYTHCKMLFREGVAEDFVFLEVNPAFESLTGLKEVVGKRVTEVIPGIRESTPKLFDIYGRVAQNGKPEQFEMYVAGLQRWFSISVYCPEPEHFVAIFDNITARKQSEQVLAESEQRFRGLVEQSLAGIYIIQDGRFAYVNPRFAEIFGYPAVSELIGVEPLSLAAEPDRGRVAENIRNRQAGEAQSINYGFTGVRKDGSLIDVGVHGAQATYGGRPAVIGLLQDVSEKKQAEEQIQRYIKQLEEAFMNTIEVATTLVEIRDPYTAGHEKRVAQIAVAIGTELGLDAHRIEGLRVGGYIHDIGKIIVPAEILTKPGRLSAAEYELIKGHPQAGYDILKNVEFPWPVAEIAYQHHERLDGSGYPRGLKGDEILLEARIMMVADVVEAMASHRPYRPSIGIEQALAEIERGRGTAYDPQVADACLRLFREKGYALSV